MERKNAWALQAGTDEKIEAFAKAYCDFIDNGKTERECVSYGVKLAAARGFEDMMAVVRAGGHLKSGDRVYVNWMNKSLMLFVVGQKPLDEGMNILGAHIDSPRIDVKQNPLYEEKDIAYLDTHYYGGIKKYQWVALPLALHGVIVRKDGTTVTVAIGEAEGDPVFCISDLLPHLAQEQMAKDAKSLIEGEALNLIIGSRPQADAEGGVVRLRPEYRERGGPGASGLQREAGRGHRQLPLEGRPLQAQERFRQVLRGFRFDLPEARTLYPHPARGHKRRGFGGVRRPARNRAVFRREDGGIPRAARRLFLPGTAHGHIQFRGGAL